MPAVLACFFQAAITAAFDCRELRASKVDYNTRLDGSQKTKMLMGVEWKLKQSYLVVGSVPGATGGHSGLEDELKRTKAS